MRALLLSLLLLIPSTAWAWEDWDKRTQDSFARTTNWIVLDWHSTDNSAAEGWDGYRELNPIMGPAPTRGEVALYFAARIGLNYWVHDLGYGDNILYQGITLGHAFAAANNYKIRGESDKIGHIVAGAIISETVYHYTGSRWKGCAAALAAGVAKETIDKRTHNFDGADAFATGLGCAMIRIEF